MKKRENENIERNKLLEELIESMYQNYYKFIECLGVPLETIYHGTTPIAKALKAETISKYNLKSDAGFVAITLALFSALGTTNILTYMEKFRPDLWESYTTISAFVDEIVDEIDKDKDKLGE